MGAGIAVLCANAGLPVPFWDMPAAKGTRNGVADAALEEIQGPRQPMQKDTEALARITVGDFEDKVTKVAGHHWVVEAII
jgi:3-hydroxyacyl-CoA dehydrogenase